MHGFGVETWSNGMVFEGYFNHGTKEPRGVLSFGDGDVYEGEFEGNMLQGKGRLTNLSQKIMYEGYWLQNNMHGQGFYIWRDGRSYQGGYQHGEKHGFGIYKYCNGSVYLGTWTQGKQDGEGVLVEPDLSMVQSVWKEGEIGYPAEPIKQSAPKYAKMLQMRKLFLIKDQQNRLFLKLMVEKQRSDCVRRKSWQA
jgi:hypothetical protein